MVQWAEKELAQADIDRHELEKKSCAAELEKAEQKIIALGEEIAQKDTRRQELEIACVQSDVYKEEERLLASKQHLQEEQTRLQRGMQKLEAEIKRESQKLITLCGKILDWEAEEILRPVQEMAYAVQKAYAPFENRGALFSQPMVLFETAQKTVAAFSSERRTAKHKIEDQVEELKEQAGQKRAALANLRKNIKDYPKGLIPFREELQEELHRNTGNPVKVYILADLLEISDDAGAVR